MSTPKPLHRLTEVKDTAEHVGTFLNAPDLASLCRTSKNTHLIFSKNFPAMKLLKAVFDADPKRVKEILKLPRPPKSKCIVLTKTNIQETFFDQKQNKAYCKREWGNISPLEAAAWCGDIFLVRELLPYVLPAQKQEAANQLKGILERKKSEQNGAFLAPYRALIQAYKTNIEKIDVLTEHGYVDADWDEVDKIWNEIWELQRLLPTYGLQEFCADYKPFEPLPSFTEPPKRSCYLYRDPKQPLEWEPKERRFGDALYKAGASQAMWGGRIGGRDGGQGDLPAFRHLCEVRIKDLCNLIKKLEGPKHSEESDFEEEKEALVRP